MKHRSAIVSLLLTILILPVILIASPVQAHGFDLSEQSYQSDNLNRYFMGRELLVDAETNDDFLNPEGQKEAPVWKNPANVKLSPTSNVDFHNLVQYRLDNLGYLQDGKSGQRGGTFITHNASEGTSNETGMQLTFPQMVSATRFDLTVTSIINVTTSTNNVNVSVAFFQNNTLVKYINTTSFACNLVSQTTKNTFDTFARITFNIVKIIVDDTACGVITTDQLVLALGRFAIYSLGNKNDAIAYTDSRLEHADWLVKRYGTIVVTSGANNLSAVPNATVIYLPGESVLFTSDSCPVAGCGNTGSKGTTLWPGTYVEGCTAPDLCPTHTCASGIDISYSGSAINEDVTGRGKISVWKVVNNCSVPIGLAMGGSVAIGNHAVRFNDQNIIYKNTYDGKNVPSLGKCWQCLGTTNLGFQTIALAYNLNSGQGPFVTFNQDTSFNLFSNFDLFNVTAVLGSGCTTQTNCELSVTIPKFTYFGNAIYVVLGTYNATNVPNLCTFNTAATVNGVSVFPAWTRSAEDRSGSGLGFFRACAWIINDLSTSNGIPTDSNGHNQYLDNSKSITYAFNITSTAWPVEARAPNGPGGNGYSLRSLQVFTSRGAERLACTSDQHICYGNINTLGTSASPTKYNFLTQTQSGSVPFANVEITESDSGVIIKTNATGLASMTNGANPNFLFVPTAGYRTAYMNLTNVTFQTVNITVNLVATNDNRTVFEYSCNTVGFDLACSGGWVRPQDAPNPCDSFDVATGKCTVNGFPNSTNYGFECSRDASTAAKPYLVGVTLTESSTGYSTLLPSNGNVANCFGTAQLLGVPKSNTVTFQWSKTGYRTLNFSAPWLSEKEEVNITSHMRTGTGVVKNVQVLSFNSTRANGIRHSDIVVIDDATSGVVNTGGVPVSFAAGLINIGCVVGLCDEAGKAIWGLLLVLFIIAIVVAMWYSTFQQAPPLVVTGSVTTGAFFVAGFVGLFPAWLLFLVAIALVLSLYKAFAPSGDSGQ